ncbi:AAA family ATPase [Patulibacter medicamentivorans]|uniref:AAA family ATPase n=1 Tax=Patulibacter medicamentivorans TaxID=1097667 RepID=UPI000590558F|nr:AAA family ATPase [Patulibacter medicamentivorans]
MPQLTSVEVEGLLGRFDHEIQFDADWDFVIVHGPNGIGKTKLLELVYSLCGGRLHRVFRLPFDTAELKYDDGTSLRVVKSGQQALPGMEEAPDLPRLHIAVSGPLGDIEFDMGPEATVPESRLRMIERELPLDRIGPELWYDFELGDNISLPEVVHRYGGMFPDDFFGRIRGSLPEQYQALVDANPVHLIETQRLLAPRVDRSAQGRRAPSPMTVVRYSADMKSRISDALARNSTTTQRLDRSFPRRVMTAQDPEVTDEQIRDRYREQGALRDRLTAVSLIDAAEADLPLPDRELEAWERRFLWIYLEDTDEKLATFVPLLQRLQLFSEIVNARFLFKDLRIDRERGFHFVTDDLKEIGPASLSSGEQHELVLAYDLLFNVSSGSLVLIDEPEISLHVSWQQEFLNDLTRVSELQSLRFMIATHSPQVIHKWWHRAKALYDTPPHGLERPTDA